MACRPFVRAALCLLAMATPWAAFAQTSNGVGPGPSKQTVQPLAPVPQPVAPAVEHLLGDPAGVRAGLDAQGITVLLDAVTEFAGNVSGGTNKGSTFASQVGFENDIDWQKLAGFEGFSTHLIMVNRSGSSDSHLFGDNLEPVQEVYGSGGDVAVHLVSIYGEQSLFDGKLDIAAGRMNVENDFASSALYCNDMNNTLCGDPKALPGGDRGHSAYPDAVWSARVKLRPTKTTYVEIGVYEVNQNLYTYPSFRSGFKFDGSADSGVYIPIEAAFQPLLGPNLLLGHYKVGFGYDTSNTYVPFSAALNPDAPIDHKTGNTQFWALFDQMLVRQGQGDADGIIVLAGLIHNDPSRSSYAEEYFTGLLDRAFWQDRPQDTVGLLMTYNTVSGELGKVQAEEQRLGLPISNSATGIQTHEIILEANYNIHVMRGVNVEPDVQYVIHPNAQTTIPDAAVFGLRAHVEF